MEGLDKFFMEILHMTRKLNLNWEKKPKKKIEWSNGFIDVILPAEHVSPAEHVKLTFTNLSYNKWTVAE